jgi:hypothetical protein
MAVDDFNGKPRPIGRGGGRQFVLISTKGGNHPRSTVTPDGVRYIRRCMKNAAQQGKETKDEMRRFLAIFLGCSEYTVMEIHRGRRFASVSD